MTAETIALANMAANSLSSAGSIVAQGRINAKTRAWNEWMYDKQRRDSLADWNMQNEYNSPAKQMERLRAAGLNPNLVYGKGADNIASPNRAAAAGSWNPKAPDFSGMNPVQAYMDTQVKQAQVDNLETQNKVLVQDAALKAATTGKTMAEAARSRFDLGLAESLRQNSIDVANQQLDQLKANTRFTLNQDERAAAQNAQSLAKGLEEILSIRAVRANTQADRERIQETIKGLRYDNQIKQLDVDLRRMGINPQSSTFFHILGRLANEMGDIGLSDFKRGGKYSFDNIIGDFFRR